MKYLYPKFPLAIFRNEGKSLYFRRMDIGYSYEYREGPIYEIGVINSYNTITTLYDYLVRVYELNGDK